MATVDKKIADILATNNGWFPPQDHYYRHDDDRRCVLITEYNNAWGGISYGLTFEGEPNRYEPSAFVGNPRTYWEVTRIDHV